MERGEEGEVIYGSDGEGRQLEGVRQRQVMDEEVMK